MQIRYVSACESVNVNVGLVSPLNRISSSNEKFWDLCVLWNKLLFNKTFYLGESYKTQSLTLFYFTLGSGGTGKFGLRIAR